MGDGRGTDRMSVCMQTPQDMRKALVDKGQAPHAAIIGCASAGRNLRVLRECLEIRYPEAHLKPLVMSSAADFGTIVSPLPRLLLVVMTDLL